MTGKKSGSGVDLEFEQFFTSADAASNGESKIHSKRCAVVCKLASKNKKSFQPVEFRGKMPTDRECKMCARVEV